MAVQSAMVAIWKKLIEFRLICSLIEDELVSLIAELPFFVCSEVVVVFLSRYSGKLNMD